MSHNRAFLARSAAMASISVALVLVALKTWASWRTGSTAMLGSLADSALDLIASLATLTGVWIASRPADEDHRFGHGKAEALAAIFQVMLIALSAFAAVLLPRRGALDHHPATTGGVGVLSGLMTGYAGMPGPPVVPYYVGRDIPRETAKASMLLIFTCASTTGLVSGAAMGVLDWTLAVLAILLFPAILVGNWLGNKASGRIEDRTWRICVGAVLGGAAVAALWKAFG